MASDPIRAALDAAGCTREEVRAAGKVLRAFPHTDPETGERLKYCLSTFVKILDAAATRMKEAARDE